MDVVLVVAVLESLTDHAPENLKSSMRCPLFLPENGCVFEGGNVERVLATARRIESSSDLISDYVVGKEIHLSVFLF